MSKVQRIKSFLAGAVMMFSAVIMVYMPDLGYPLVVAILSVSLLFYGVRSLIYYFTMARFMVGGKASLYKGIIIFDLGVFTMTLADIPNAYVMLYLVAANLIAGGIDILSAVDSRRSGSPSWRLKLVSGAVSVLIAIACIVFGRNQTAVVYIYCAGLLYSAVYRIFSAFRKTAIIYIQ